MASRPGLLIIAGGVLMAALWLVFTSVHGPTSFNENRPFLGGDMHFWGMLLGVVPHLLIAAGLASLRPFRDGGASKVAVAGYAIVLIGLLTSATLDFLMQGLAAPIFIPLIALGAILFAIGSGGTVLDARSRAVMLSVGLLLAVAFAVALVPLEVSDPIGGYRIYGFVAHFLAGLGWALFGYRTVRRARAAADLG